MRWCALSFGGGDFRTCGCVASVVFVRCRHGWVVEHPFGCALVAGFHGAARHAQPIFFASGCEGSGKVGGGVAANELEAAAELIQDACAAILTARAALI